MSQNDHEITNQPAIKSLLSKMPEDIANSFTDKQLAHLLTAVGSNKWEQHKVDYRGTFKVPFHEWRYYYVFLAGKNHRELGRKEQRMSLFLTATIALLFLIFSTTLGLLIIYLVKSALGIDLFPSFSLGIWHWFKEVYF